MLTIRLTYLTADDQVLRSYVDSYPVSDAGYLGRLGWYLHDPEVDRGHVLFGCDPAEFFVAKIPRGGRMELEALA
jgi:hypothetical protein